MEALSRPYGGDHLQWHIPRFESLMSVLNSLSRQCIHRKTVMAVYQPNEVSPVFEWNGISSMHYANLTINRAGLPIVTEILTTLLLIRMANFLGW